jgi:hypothetical protein
MKVNFSPRGTGACPICKKINRCPLKKRFADTLLPHESENGEDFEMVIYVCPYFIEQA